jgi:hypothetical protein
MLPWAKLDDGVYWDGRPSRHGMARAWLSFAVRPAGNSTYVEVKDADV